MNSPARSRCEHGARTETSIPGFCQGNAGPGYLWKLNPPIYTARPRRKRQLDPSACRPASCTASALDIQLQPTILMIAVYQASSRCEITRPRYFATPRGFSISFSREVSFLQDHFLANSVLTNPRGGFIDYTAVMRTGRRTRSCSCILRLVVSRARPEDPSIVFLTIRIYIIRCLDGKCFVNLHLSRWHRRHPRRKVTKLICTAARQLVYYIGVYWFFLVLY